MGTGVPCGGIFTPFQASIPVTCYFKLELACAVLFVNVPGNIVHDTVSGVLYPKIQVSEELFPHAGRDQIATLGANNQVILCLVCNFKLAGQISDINLVICRMVGMVKAYNTGAQAVRRIHLNVMEFPVCSAGVNLGFSSLVCLNIHLIFHNQASRSGGTLQGIGGFTTTIGRVGGGTEEESGISRIHPGVHTVQLQIAGHCIHSVALCSQRSGYGNVQLGCSICTLDFIDVGSVRSPNKTATIVSHLAQLLLRSQYSFPVFPGQGGHVAVRQLRGKGGGRFVGCHVVIVQRVTGFVKCNAKGTAPQACLYGVIQSVAVLVGIPYPYSLVAGNLGCNLRGFNGQNTAVGFSLPFSGYSVPNPELKPCQANRCIGYCQHGFTTACSNIPSVHIALVGYIIGEAGIRDVSPYPTRKFVLPYHIVFQVCAVVGIIGKHGCLKACVLAQPDGLVTGTNGTEVQQFQRSGVTGFPERSVYPNDNLTVLGYFFAGGVVYTGHHNAVTVCVQTRQVGDYILVIRIHGTAIYLASRHAQLGVIAAQNLHGVVCVGNVGAKQVVQITYHTSNAGGSGHAAVKYSLYALVLVGAQVPAVFATSNGGIKYRLCTIQVHGVNIVVPVALKALDGGPSTGQGNIFRQLIASINGIPVATAIL